MEKRSQSAVIAVAAIAVVVAGVLLATSLNRGSDSGSLTGRTWQLASITGKTPAYQGVIPPAEQPLHTIAFATDGTFTARADCNSMSGTYVLGRSDGMTITPGPSTLVACPDGSFGSLFAHALVDVTTWAISGADLTLTTSDGGTGMFVDSATALAVPTPPASVAPSLSPAPSPSTEPTPSPTASPSPTPTTEPTASPTASPTPPASAPPTAAPTAAPTATPASTPKPTAAPSATRRGDPNIDSEADAHPHPGPERPSARR